MGTGKRRKEGKKGGVEEGTKKGRGGMGQGEEARNEEEKEEGRKEEEKEGVFLYLIAFHQEESNEITKAVRWIGGWAGG